MSQREAPTLEFNQEDKEWLLSWSLQQLKGACVLASHGEWTRVRELLLELRAAGKASHLPSLSTLAVEALEACEKQDRNAASGLIEKLEKKCASLLKKEQKQVPNQE